MILVKPDGDSKSIVIRGKGRYNTNPDAASIGCRRSSDNGLPIAALQGARGELQGPHSKDGNVEWTVNRIRPERQDRARK